MIFSPRGPRALFYVALFPLLAATAPLPARAAAPRPATLAPRAALVQVAVENGAASARFATLGLDVVAARPGRWTRILAWPGDLETLRAAGFDYVVLEADAGLALARERGIPEKPVAPPHTAVVPPFGSGSMGGFYTLAEVNTYLSDIAANDPNGIVSNVVALVPASRQGRLINAIRIANEAGGDHTRPRVLYTALHHAREPAGMQNLIYFMNKLLQGYGTDPNFTYLVDHREMWFVPVVNPDGYVINETQYFGGGGFGLWRKNARDNNNDTIINGSDGVDLNRNYGYQWGFDNAGSSGTFSSQTYRGTAGFSEPETRAIRDFCVLHGFRTAQNFHTFFETTLYPWGYNGTNNPDSPYYVRLVDDMVRDNHYIYGFPVEILYPVNGEANDWMYGDQVLKPKIISMTSECGTQNDDFWPPAARILPIAHQNLHANIVLAYAAGTFVHPDLTQPPQIVSQDGWLHPNGTAEVALTLRNDGLDASNGALTVTATTNAPGITITDGISSFPALASTATAGPAAGDRIGLAAAASVPAGTVVPLLLTIQDTGSYVFADTAFVTVGQPLVVFSDNASGGLANWTSVGGWGTQNVAGNLVFSDSPAGAYAGNTDSRLTLVPPLDLSGGVRAFLELRSQWFIEEGYDFATVEVSTNGGTTWTAIAGRSTRPGHGTTGAYAGGRQTAGTPGYDGSRRFLAPDVFDLSAYVGMTNLRLRLRLMSDTGTELDGWLVDDIRVLVYPTDATDVAAGERPTPRIDLVATSANPTRGMTRLRASFAAPTPFRAAVYGVDGRLVRLLAAGMAAAGWRDLEWDGSGANGLAVAAGTYVIRLESDAGNVSQRVVRLH